jgi:hypothetical protein
MRKVGLSLVLASSMLLFNACGNGGSTTPTAKDVKGQFIDAPVSGLKYECDKSGLKGETNANGEYTCKEGDTVSFFAGKYKIGSTTASTGITTPYSLYPKDVQSAVNVAQLLQTLDSDGDGVITIPAGYNALDNVVSAPTADDFENIVGSTMGQTLISEEVASAKMNDNIVKKAPTIDLKALLGGKTFYIDDGKIVFNAEVTSLTYTDDEESGTETVSIDGNKLIFSDDTDRDEDGDEDGYTLFVGQTSDYLIFADYNADGSYDEETRIFYDKAKAKADWEKNHTFTNLVSGRVSFESGSVPTDAWVRIVPLINHNNHNWEGITCQVASNGNFGDICYSDDEDIASLFTRTETYQIVVFKNHVKPTKKDWDCAEDVYKNVGANMAYGDWSAIDVLSSNYQDHSREVCDDNN